MELLKQCKTCEFNFSGTCAGHGDTYKYGEAITNDTLGCDDWGADLEYFTEITLNAPWYIREPYNDFKISYSEFLKLIEMDIAGNAIEVNIFDAIREIYGLSLVDLAVILDVSFGVLHRARSISVPAKRLKHFSAVLCIPESLFSMTTTHDFVKLEKYKSDFKSRMDTDIILKNIPDWKQTLIIDIANNLHCPIHIAKEIARVDKLNWTYGSNDILTDSEETLLDIANKYGHKHKKSLGSIEYSLDIGCRPHIKMRFYGEE